MCSKGEHLPSFPRRSGDSVQALSGWRVRLLRSFPPEAGGPLDLGRELTLALGKLTCLGSVLPLPRRRKRHCFWPPERAATRLPSCCWTTSPTARSRTTWTGCRGMWPRSGCTRTSCACWTSPAGPGALPARTAWGPSSAHPGPSSRASRWHSLGARRAGGHRGRRGWGRRAPGGGARS